MNASARQLVQLEIELAAGLVTGRAALVAALWIITSRWGSTSPIVEAVAAEFRSAETVSAADACAVLAFATSLVSEETCHCGSHQRAQDCCYERATSDTPRRVDVTPRRPRTNVAIDGCYAGILQDCRKPLTREHYVSKSVLEAIYEDGTPTFLTSGIVGLSERRLNSSALAAKVLCERHNNALSVLDSVGADFIGALQEVSVSAADGNLDSLSLRRSEAGQRARHAESRHELSHRSERLVPYSAALPGSHSGSDGEMPAIRCTSHSLRSSSQAQKNSAPDWSTTRWCGSLSTGSPHDASASTPRRIARLLLLVVPGRECLWLNLGEQDLGHARRQRARVDLPLHDRQHALVWHGTHALAGGYSITVPPVAAIVESSGSTLGSTAGVRRPRDAKNPSRRSRTRSLIALRAIWPHSSGNARSLGVITAESDGRPV